MKKLLLIDGDEFIYRCTAALEKETRWDDFNHVLYSNVVECWDNLQGMLKRIFDRFDCTDHVLCFSAPPNFRQAIDPTYKGHRSPRKPLCYAELRERVEGEYVCRAMPGLEADDVMGILATKPGKAQRIIVSQDKDMKTIPTTVWNGKDLEVVSEVDADYAHMYQTLIGDTSDGYKGCPGIGPKKAEAILQLTDKDNMPYMVSEWWSRVKSTYEKAGLTEADALTQARLARILRWSDWDSEKKEPILWMPQSN